MMQWLKLSLGGLALAAGLAAVASAQQSGIVTEFTPERVTELYFDAARQGRVDLLDELIKAGMRPDAHDHSGFTPLILAAYNG
jgi:ankyrin repeat protein